ncbi:PseG/SpsG family protein [Stackebrandtia soli]|uniref:PseG/SpsG family protein n=1 Tax=Stackebrandtia soli TaxID=1892856 RepID=UPI0039EBA71A
MTPTRIGVRCDAGAAIGTGHATRCLALAEELRRRDVEVEFFVDPSEVPWLAERFATAGHRPHPPPSTPDDMLAATAAHRLDGWVLDSYTLDPTCAVVLRDRGCAVLAIVDGDTRGQLADIHLDQNLGAERTPDHHGGDSPSTETAARFETDDRPPNTVTTPHAQPEPDGLPNSANTTAPLRVEPGDPPPNAPTTTPNGLSPHTNTTAPLRLAGLRYVLLSDAILDRRPTAPRFRHLSQRPSILGVFGGTDAYGAAPVVAALLAETGVPADIVMVAANESRRRELERVLPAAGQTIAVIDPTSELPRLIARSDLVISAAGTSTWEILCLGAAAALVRVADNQRLGYNRVIDAGLAVGLGGLDELATVGTRDTLRALLTSPNRLDRLRATAWAAVDGDGRGRVADALLSTVAARKGARS